MVGNTVKQTVIIAPRAFQGETTDYLFETNEIYLGSASSDGDVGNFEIYISTSENDVSTDPNSESWKLLTSGNLQSDWNLEKVYDGDTIKFRYMKIVGYARSKGYFELAAAKVFLH